MIVNKRLGHDDTSSTGFLLNREEIIVYEANYVRELTREILYYISHSYGFVRISPYILRIAVLVETTVRNYFSFSSINYLKIY